MADDDDFDKFKLPAEPPFIERISAAAAPGVKAIFRNVKAHWIGYGDKVDFFAVKSVVDLPDGGIEVEYRLCTPSERAIARLENFPPDDWVLLTDLKVIETAAGFEVRNEVDQVVAIIPGREKESGPNLSMTQARAIAARVRDLLEKQGDFPD